MCTETSDDNALEGTWWWAEEPFGRFIPEVVWRTSDGDALVGEGVYVDAGRASPSVEIYTDVVPGLRPAGQWWSCVPGYNCVSNNLTGAGDFDGDGYDELLSGGQDWDVYTAACFLLSGDSSTWPTPGTPMPDSAAASWVQLRPGDDFATSMAGDVDLNADGLSDFIVYAPENNEVNDFQGTLHVMLGRTGPLPVLENAGEEITFHHQSYGTIPLDDHFFQFTVARDLDGDGCDDLIATGYEEGVDMLWASGSSLVGSDGADLVDVFDHVANTAVDPWVVQDGGRIGDLDDDGLNDVLVYGRDQVDSNLQALSVLSGAALAGGGAEAEIVLAEARGGNFGLNVWSITYDLDGDDVLDPMVWAPLSSSNEDQYRSCAFATSMLPLGGTIDIGELGPCFTGRPILADLEHDGVPEFHITDDRGGDTVEVLSLPAFDIPWGDPTRW
jgi:hypothetical protein